jgi:hypothetical protein
MIPEDDEVRYLHNVGEVLLVFLINEGRDVQLHEVLVLKFFLVPDDLQGQLLLLLMVENLDDLIGVRFGGTCPKLPSPAGPISHSGTDEVARCVKV